MEAPSFSEPKNNKRGGPEQDMTLPDGMTDGAGEACTPSVHQVQPRGHHAGQGVGAGRESVGKGGGVLKCVSEKQLKMPPLPPLHTRASEEGIW